MSDSHHVDEATKFQRSPSWAGVYEGESVVVNIPRERRRHWVFVAHVRNVVTNDEWIEVRGGRSGEAITRSFRTGLIYPKGSRSSSRENEWSLLEAPRLPFEY